MLGRYDDALNNLTQAAAGGSQPGKAWLEVARLEILHQLQQDLRNFDKANKAIDHAADALPRDAKEAVEPTLLRAEILAIQNDLPDAEKLLRDARTAHPDRVEFWTALADVADRRNDEKGALAILDEADQALQDRVELRVSRAIHLAADPTPERLAALDVLVKKDHSGFSAEDQDRLLSGLAEAELRAGQPVEAAALLEELARTPAHRTDLRLRLTLFDLSLHHYDDAKDDAARKERLEGVDQALKDIREVEGGGGAFYELGQGLRSTHLARQNPKDARRSLDEAWAALDRAAELQPNWSAVELARADVADLGGDPEGMISHLKEAIRLEEGRSAPQVIGRLVEALNQRGRYAESKEYLGRMKQSLLVNSPLGKLAANVDLNTGDLSRATDLIQAAVGKDPTDYRDLLLRGRLHEAMRQDKDAEDDYRKATELAPKQPDVWIAYVLFLGNHGHDAAAAAVVKNDVALKVAKDRAALAVAECYEVLSRAADASAAYDAALAERPDDPVVVRAATAYRLRTGHVREAVPLLDRIVKRELNSPDADVEWSKRALALILSGSTDYRDFRRAVELVGLQLDANGVLLPEPESSRQDSVENRRAQCPRAGHAAAAPVPRPGDPAARGLAIQRPRRSVRAGRPLRRGRRRGEGGRGPQAPGRARRPGRQAGVPVAVRPGDAAPGAVRQGAARRRGGADRPPGAAGEGPQRRPRARSPPWSCGRGCWRPRGRVIKPSMLLRAYVNRVGAKPEEPLMLVASLGRQGRFDDAFDLCEKERLWDKCAPELVGGVCEALLRGMPTAGKQRERVEAWLESAIKKNPKVVVLKMHLADLYDLRGEYEKAADEYREVLKDEPGNVVALNNLAFLLSQQTGQGREALQYIDAAVNGIGRRADLLDTRGSVELALGQTQTALADFTEAVNDAPTGTRLFHLAQAQYEARDRESAVKTLQRAKADFGLQPSNVHPTEQQFCQTLMNELKVR